MSAHFSKYNLNSYGGVPYFEAHAPVDYPLSLTLQKCRAFRRLPPRLRELAALAKRWAIRVYGPPAGIPGIERWYDDEGNEIDSITGEPLTDEQIDAEWGDQTDLDDFEVKDIPLPAGGFVDPDTWEPEEEPEEEEDEYEGPTEAQIAREVDSGRERAMKYYGIEPKDAKGKSADALARLIYLRISRPRNAPASS